MTSQFTIVAVVRDRRAGESTFTADELRSRLRTSLRDLHLDVGFIEVRTPHSYQHSRFTWKEVLFQPPALVAIFMWMLAIGVVITAFVAR